MSRFQRFLGRFEALSHLQPEEVSLDLGSSLTRFLVDRKMVFHQPSCLTIHPGTEAVLEIGERAYNLAGKTTDHLVTAFPIKQALIAEPESARLFLEALLKKTNPQASSFTFVKPTVRCGVPSSASALERATFETVLNKSGFGKVILVSKAQALATRLKRPENTDTALCVIDVGGETTEVIFYMGRRVLASKTLSIGGRAFTQVMKRFLKIEARCEVGTQTVEKLKTQLTTLTFLEHQKTASYKVVVRGKDVVSGLPLTAPVEVSTLVTHLKPVVTELITEVKNVLATIPADLASISLENGVYLTGGGSQFAGLAEFISDKLQTQVIRSATPQDDVVLGLKSN